MKRKWHCGQLVYFTSSLHSTWVPAASVCYLAAVSLCKQVTPDCPPKSSWWAARWLPVSSVFWNRYYLKLFSFFPLKPFSPAVGRLHSMLYHPWHLTEKIEFQCYETTARCCHFFLQGVLPSDLTDLFGQGVNVTRQNYCSLKSCWFSPRQSSEVLCKLKTNAFFLRTQYIYCDTVPLRANTKVSLLLDETSKPQWLRSMSLGSVSLKGTCQCTGVRDDEAQSPGVYILN